MSAKRVHVNPRLSRKQIKPILNFRSLLFLLGIIFVAFIAYKLFFANHLWTDDNRLVLVTKGDDDEVLVIDLDPVTKEIITLSIPKNTLVEVAGNLGKWKIASVWNLGEESKQEGGLLARTIVSQFGFPVATWSSSEVLGLVDESPISQIKSLSRFYRSNLSFGDKVAIALFSITVDNSRRININMEDTSLIKKSLLEDGSDGYIVTGIWSPKLNSYFSDYIIGKDDLKVVIDDGTGSDTVGKNITRALEIMGGKVVGINKVKEEEGNGFICLIRGNNKEAITRFSAVLGCIPNIQKPKGNYDIQILMGSKFIQYF